ncbi:MAG TPA: TRAP transporter small permease subunit [Zeimonas sp.]|nr:TRAP transporter small permease subunit [Zeimonas sp.]
MERFRDALVRALEWIASALLVAILLITVVDVVFRYLIGRPLAASFELTEILLAVMIFASIGVAMARDDHIEVTLLDPLLERLPRFNRAMRVASRMAIAAAFLLLGIWVFELGQGKRVEFTPVMHLPLAPVAWAVAAALVVAAVLAVLSVFAKTPPGD